MPQFNPYKWSPSTANSALYFCCLPLWLEMLRRFKAPLDMYGREYIVKSVTCLLPILYPLSKCHLLPPNQVRPYPVSSRSRMYMGNTKPDYGHRRPGDSLAPSHHGHNGVSCPMYHISLNIRWSSSKCYQDTPIIKRRLHPIDLKCRLLFSNNK